MTPIPSPPAVERGSRVRALFEEVINRHDESAIDRFTSSPTIAATLRGLLDGFPDLRFQVVWLIEQDDRVVTFLEMTGTQAGPWLMVREPTQRQLRANVLLALQFDDDAMVVDSWLGTNFIAMLAQLGWGVAPHGRPVPVPA